MAHGDSTGALLADRSLEQTAGTTTHKHQGRSVELKALDAAKPCPVTEPGPERWREVSACVAMLLESCSNVQVPVEKRSLRRYPFRRPLTITPVETRTGRPDHAKSFAAFGLDISATGIGFLARQLVPARKAVVTCDGPENRPVSILFEPRWVRFTRGGWYQTGGRLLAVLPNESDAPPRLRLLESPPEAEADEAVEELA